MNPILNIIAISILSLFLLCCGHHDKKAEAKMDKAESLMETSPDSALLLLTTDMPNLTTERSRARHALLTSMALDKNYIDTTTFDVLQPAIDYYLEHGSADEKLATLYYQGRIYQNCGDTHEALDAFIKGIEAAKAAKDPMLIARTLVAAGCILHDYLDYNGYIETNLKAATIYASLSRKELESDCLLNAYDGAVTISDRERADSLYEVCNRPEAISTDLQPLLQDCNLSYMTEFGSANIISDYIDNLDEMALASSNGILDLALACHKTGDDFRAKRLLEAAAEAKCGFDTLKYLSISVAIHKGLRNFEEALSHNEIFSHKYDSINYLKKDYEIRSIEEKHSLENKAREESIHKSRIIGLCGGCIIILLISLLIVSLTARNRKMKEELAYEKSKTKEAENRALRSEREKMIVEKDKLALENDRLQLEMVNKALEAKNLTVEKEKLTLENDRLQLEMANKALEAKNLTAEKEKFTLENDRLQLEMANKALEAKNLTAEKEKLTLENDRLQLEMANKVLEAKYLIVEKEKLTLENEKLQLEKTNKVLEAENLAHRLDALEDECITLKAVIDKHKANDELPDAVREVVKVRFDKVNQILAKFIVEYNTKKKINREDSPYDQLFKEIIIDANEFMNSNRLAFQASHPRFIKFLEDNGLTDKEINYICLYALGLSGKEVGVYINKRSHMNISCAIRKKLGIGDNDGSSHRGTYLGIYVKKILKEF